MKAEINFFTKRILFVIASISIFSACQKEINQHEPQSEIAGIAARDIHGHLKQTNTYSSDVVQAWINLQKRLYLQEGGSMKMKYQQLRWFAYIGVTLYESVLPGMPSYQSLFGQLDQMPEMPSTQPGMAYYWPACANAALASMNRNFFSTLSSAYLPAIDSLENVLNNEYQNETSAEELQRSVEFGNEIARRIYEWSKTDGSDAAFVTNYQPPIGPGYWAPASLAAVVPLWGNVRTIVAGSLDGTLPPPPTTYSNDPSSDFYKMAKDVYDVSQTLTTDQKAIALFWADRFGFSPGGHSLSILGQLLVENNASLDKAAIAYAKTGIEISDATVGGWKVKFIYNLIRPITYIRNVLMHTTWNPLFATPGHPEYVSDFSMYGAESVALTSLFGNSYHFTDHTYDLYLGLNARSFDSFEEAFIEANHSRYYAGTNFFPSTEAAYQLGVKVAQNIDNKLNFLKE